MLTFPVLHDCKITDLNGLDEEQAHVHFEFLFKAELSSLSMDWHIQLQDPGLPGKSRDLVCMFSVPSHQKLVPYPVDGRDDLLSGHGDSNLPA
jgi:hypothetical protein